MRSKQKKYSCKFCIVTTPLVYSIQFYHYIEKEENPQETQDFVDMQLQNWETVSVSKIDQTAKSL